MSSVWNTVETKRPLCYITGDFDGKQSNRVLVMLNDGNYVIARCYSGFIDGSEFFDWYEGIEEYELQESEIKYWTEIPD